MNTVYKYPIQENKEQEKFFVRLPKGAEVISAIDMSPTSGYIYALVDNTIEETEDREVVWYGTGWPVDEYKTTIYQFLGTFKQTPAHFAPMYWHVWVQKPIMGMYNIFDKLLC